MKIIVCGCCDWCRDFSRHAILTAALDDVIGERPPATVAIIHGDTMNGDCCVAAHAGARGWAVSSCGIDLDAQRIGLDMIVAFGDGEEAADLVRRARTERIYVHEVGHHHVSQAKGKCIVCGKTAEQIGDDMKSLSCPGPAS